MPGWPTQRFRRIFSGDRWERLARAGGRVQRPLWASTSTKDPAYPDVMYVEELVGPDTVNTMTQATLDAFRDHGRVRPAAVLEGAEEAEPTLALLAERGVDLSAVTARLLDEGLAAFEKDLRKLLETIQARMEEARVVRRHAASALGYLEEPVRRRLDRMTEDAVVPRIWRKDPAVWKPESTEIANRLGWLTVTELMRERVRELEAFAKQVAADGFTHALLLGMGGSSLAPEMFVRTFGTAPGSLELIVLDTTHPGTIARVEASLDLDRTLFLVASKSGTTVETFSHLAHFWEKVPRGQRFVAITDAGTPLETLALARAFRAVFLNPPDIGGRYSALSLFGLVPAALIGADLHGLLDGAEEMACACDPCIGTSDNPGAWLGAAMGGAARAGRDKLTLVLPPEVTAFGDWSEQLLAESTGKEGTGIIPVAGEDLGPSDVYGEDRLFAALGEHRALDPLRSAGHPVVQVDFSGPAKLGAELFRFEFATAVAGHILGINPFDQSDVEEAKLAAREVLEGAGPEAVAVATLSELLESVKAPDYVAIQAYLDRTPETEAALHRVRLAIRDRHQVATTMGFGPRFLHSTGQLHKGGPDSGVFIQVVDRGREVDLPIPGKPYTFGRLIDAQALGDLRALFARGRRLARVTPEELMDVV
ncbi:MAG: transaldolase family protein [Actinomycetota bacterium]